MMVPTTLASRIVIPVALMITGALAATPAAHAATSDGDPPAGAAAPASDQEVPGGAPASGPPPAAFDERASPAATDNLSTTAAAVNDLLAKRAWGIGLRGRFVSVPGWLLGLFTKHNHPLLTFGHFGIEGFRRVGPFDIALAFSYQNMSPPDGNWLGDGRDAAVDTRYLQFRGLSLYSADISLIWHPMLTSWFGMHLGGGLGVAVVRGELFLSPMPSVGCTDNNIDDISMCRPPPPFVCTSTGCTYPSSLPRSASGDVLPLVPIVNIVFGVDFRLPNVKGWEARLEAGFYDAFFAGFGVAYTF